MRRARCLPRLNSETLMRPRSGMDTLPRFAAETSNDRALPTRRTRSPPKVRRRTTRPGRRILMRTPSRAWTLTRSPRTGRVVRRTSSGCSPGSAVRDRLARSVRTALAPGRSVKRGGVIRNHCFDAGCRPSARRVASITTGSAPSFRSVIFLAVGGVSTSSAGETESATRGVSAPAPSAEGAGTNTIAVTHAAVSPTLNARPR